MRALPDGRLDAPRREVIILRTLTPNVDRILKSDVASIRPGASPDGGSDGTPNNAHNAAPMPDAADTWHPLHLFNLYRMFLSGTFSLLVLWGNLPHPLGSTAPQQFGWVTFIYLLVSLLNAMTIHQRTPGFQVQVHLQSFSDIAFITLLVHASGGIASGVGMLLVVTVAGGALLCEKRTGKLFAAMATIAILAEELYTTLNDPFQEAILTQAGIYGIVFFTTAIVANRLASRLRQSDDLARRRGVDLANLAQTNAYIIRHIQAGIMVLNGSDRIHVINSAAWRLLGQPEQAEKRPLAEVVPSLHQCLIEWRNSGHEAATALALGDHEVIPRFTPLGSADDAATLVFLEDTTELSEQAQQMRLASLGRLTASIAHEIRNPLGAISHAAQLLQEAEHSHEEGLRLQTIIVDQSRRVNGIVEDVLSLSRRALSHPRVLELKPLLEKCSRECLGTIALPAERLSIHVEPPDLRAYIDPSQLSQVLWNLCSNAVAQKPDDGDPLRIALEARYDPFSPAVLLDVVDNGPGVLRDIQDQIFEPFFTRSQGGTGLGLYMSRELCESNRAELTLVPGGHGARFRIRIPDRGFLSSLATANETAP